MTTRLTECSLFLTVTLMISCIHCCLKLVLHLCLTHIICLLHSGADSPGSIGKTPEGHWQPRALCVLCLCTQTLNLETQTPLCLLQTMNKIAFSLQIELNDLLRHVEMLLSIRAVNSRGLGSVSEPSPNLPAGTRIMAGSTPQTRLRYTTKIVSHPPSMETGEFQPAQTTPPGR